MVVEAEDQEQIRPLAGVEGEVCFKKDLTGPTLLEISDFPKNQDFGQRCDFWRKVELNNSCEKSWQLQQFPALLRASTFSSPAFSE